MGLIVINDEFQYKSENSKMEREGMNEACKNVPLEKSDIITLRVYLTLIAGI